MFMSPVRIQFNRRYGCVDNCVCAECAAAAAAEPQRSSSSSSAIRGTSSCPLTVYRRMYLRKIAGSWEVPLPMPRASRQGAAALPEKAEQSVTK